jgi:hypothetical protein
MTRLVSHVLMSASFATWWSRVGGRDGRCRSIDLLIQLHCIIVVSRRGSGGFFGSHLEMVLSLSGWRVPSSFPKIMLVKLLKFYYFVLKCKLFKKLV